ncbi:hypothetical protein ACFL5F_08710 [Planctomycetota bacterium]
MFRNNRKEWSRTSPYHDYVVYFYESGRFERYLQNQKSLVSGLSYGPVSSYDFSSDLTDRARFPRHPTVEQIVANGYFAATKNDPVEAIISDKRQTAFLGLDDVISQIRHRYEVYEKNIYEMEISKCSTINGFYCHEAYRGPPDSRVDYSVSKRMDKLYQQQRDERINLWRDVSRLRLSLPEKAQEYLTAYRKVSILEDQKGDAP